MNAKLVLVEGGKTVVVEPRLPSVIGRSLESDVKVPDGQVSRRHCELYEYDSKVAVRDLGSVNGTQVNGHRIQQDTLLAHGDTLSVGKVTFRIEYEGMPEIARQGDAEDVTTIAPDTNESTVHSQSAIVKYQSSGQGSVINVVETAAAADDGQAEPGGGDDDLRDFLMSLGR
jgi:pSer/pThr/pTyr-binding forkhead associated (FHA) protein